MWVRKGGSFCHDVFGRIAMDDFGVTTSRTDTSRLVGMHGVLQWIYQERPLYIR